MRANQALTSCILAKIQSTHGRVKEYIGCLSAMNYLHGHATCRPGPKLLQPSLTPGGGFGADPYVYGGGEESLQGNF